MVEKMLNISGTDIKFKSTAGTLRYYRNNFGRDMLKDVAILQKRMGEVEKNSSEQFKVIDLELFENIAWAMARTANPDIKPIEEWLDDFETFAITKILPEIMNLLVDNMQTENQPKN